MDNAPMDSAPVEDIVMDFGGKRGPPANHAAWSKYSNSVMVRARNQSMDMLTRLQHYEAAEAANKRAAQEQAARAKEAVKKAAKSRVDAHTTVINSSQQIIRDIEDAMQRLEDVLSRLTHERYARFADLQVNVRRTDLRDKRPAPENFKDQLALHLDEEKKGLLKSREEILVREGEIKKFHKELALCRTELSRDTGYRRLEVEHELAEMKAVVQGRVDLAPLEGDPDGAGLPLDPSGPLPPVPGATGQLPPVPGAAPPAPAAPAAPASNEAPPPDAGNEAAPPTGEDPQVYIKRATNLLTKVDNFCVKSEDAIVRSRREGYVVTAQVTKSLARRTVDLAVMKKSLEQHIADVNYAIGQAQRSIAKQEKRIDPNDKIKMEKLKQTKACLGDMLRTRAQLTEDLRFKIDALNIDNQCRRVTPQVAAERPKSGKKLGRISSAPNFHSGSGSFDQSSSNDVGAFLDNSDEVKPNSPAGVSKTLRASGSAAVLSN